MGPTRSTACRWSPRGRTGSNTPRTPCTARDRRAPPASPEAVCGASPPRRMAPRTWWLRSCYLATRSCFVWFLRLEARTGRGRGGKGGRGGESQYRSTQQHIAAHSGTQRHTAAHTRHHTPHNTLHPPPFFLTCSTLCSCRQFPPQLRYATTNLRDDLSG